MSKDPRPAVYKNQVKRKVSKRLGQKRDKYLPESLPLLLPPCKICGKKASGIHYGVNTCEACKGFFRRYLKRKEPYVCDKGWNCDLDIRSKGPNCSACRMKKCLTLGMSKEGVRQGRYTLTERTNRILEFKRLEKSRANEWTCSEKKHNPDGSFQSDSRLFDNSEKSSTELEDSDCNPDKFIKTEGRTGYDPDESINDSEHNLNDSSEDTCTSRRMDMLYSERLQNSFEHSCSSKQSMLLELSSLTAHTGDSPTEYTSSSAEGSPQGKQTPRNTGTPGDLELPVDVQEVVGALVKAYRHLQHITQSLSDGEIRKRLDIGFARHQDKVDLFGNLDPIPTKEYNEIYEKTNLDVDSRTQNSSRRREEFGLAMADYVAFSNEIPGFNELSVRDKATLVKVSRLDFFLSLEYRAKDPETEMMISYSGRAVHLSEACAYLPQDMLRSWWKLTYDLRGLQMTTEEHATLLALCLMSTDRCKLESPESVQKIEATLVNTMMSLLQRRYREKAGLQFSAYISLMTKLRGISEEYHAVYRKICEDKVLIARAPELLSMLFDE